MNTSQHQKNELEKFAQGLMDMLSEHAQDLKDAISAEFKIMNSNLCHGCVESKMKKDGSK